MEIINKEEKAIIKGEEIRYKLTPQYTSWTESNQILLRVVLPGVSKYNIEMKALKDFFFLRAKRNDILYSLNLQLNSEISPELTVAKYNEGLLQVNFEIHDPIKDAFEVMKPEYTKEVLETESKYRIFPNIYRRINFDENVVHIEVVLPGVKRENISLKILPTWGSLVAKRKKEEYVADFGFGAEVVPIKTNIEYSNGYLRINAVIKNPLEDARIMKIE